jgi:hypothetical protein
VHPKTTDKDKHKITNLAINSNLSCRQISALTGVGKTKIAEIIQEAKENPDVTLFAQSKDKILEGLQRKLINLADDAALKTMLKKRGFTDLAILEDKIRLIRGQSTNNTLIDVRALIMQVEDERHKTPENSPPPIEIDNSSASD